MSDENKKYVRLNERESLLLAVLGLVVTLFFGICFLVILFDSRSFVDSTKPVGLISTGGFLLVGLSVLRSSYKRKIESWTYVEPPKKEIAELKDDQGYVQSLLDERLKLHVADITSQSVDAIVNPANSSLTAGNGVDGQIHRCGGEALNAACRKLRLTDFRQGLPTGQVALTTGGKLAATWVIHAAAPIYRRHHGREAELLADCYRNALLLAREKGLKTIAFPAISTGLYDFPLEEAATVVGRVLKKFLVEDKHFEEIRLVFFSEQKLQTFFAHYWK